MKLKTRDLSRLCGYLGIILLIVATLSCKDTPTTEETPEASIAVSNECGAAIDVFMNGTYQFSLENYSFNTIQNIALATHEMTAKRKGTETLVLEDSVEINSFTQYLWTVRSFADLLITNNYGEVLYIYGDGALKGELSDGDTKSIKSIPYGEHHMEAKKLDNNIVATLSLDFQENKEYVWTISK
jgi:hypothetical protein